MKGKSWFTKITRSQDQSLLSLSPLKIYPLRHVVANLIDADNKQRVDKLEQHFIKENIEAIIQIPLPRSREENVVLWHFDKRWEYTVKSGYQIALAIKQPSISSSQMCIPTQKMGLGIGNFCGCLTCLKISRFSCGG